MAGEMLQHLTRVSVEKWQVIGKAVDAKGWGPVSSCA